MRISHQYKFVFIAIPRTGSTSIRSTLDDLSEVKSVLKYQITTDNPFYNHISAEEICSIFSDRGWDWDAYTKFCVVRNPYDRAVSLYHHRIDTQSRTAPGKSAIYNFIRQLKYKHAYNRTFTQWLDSPESQKGLSRSVRDFTHDSTGNCLIDRYIRFENIDSEFSLLAKELGFFDKFQEIKKINATKKRNGFKSYYDERTKQIIQDRYKYEIESFGYEF